MEDHMHRRILSPGTLLILALCVSFQLCARSEVFAVDGQKSRNVEDITPPTATASGAYYALLIGNNKYRYIRGLETALNDVDAAAALLGERYGFKTKVLHDVTRNEILTALNEFRRSLPQD